jgi:hypothetical protein
MIDTVDDLDCTPVSALTELLAEVDAGAGSHSTVVNRA